VRRADNLTTLMRRLSRNLGASTSCNPKGLSRPAMGLFYLFHRTTYLDNSVYWSSICSSDWFRGFRSVGSTVMTNSLLRVQKVQYSVSSHLPFPKASCGDNTISRQPYGRKLLCVERDCLGNHPFSVSQFNTDLRKISKIFINVDNIGSHRLSRNKP
jgi:hypothetical protein